MGIWVALIVAALVTSTALLGDALTTEFSFTNNPESKRADKLLEERLRGPRDIPEIVMVQSETLTVENEAFRSRVEELQQRILDVGADKVTGGITFYPTGGESLVSGDRKTTIIPFVMEGEFDDATKNVEEVLEIVREANGVGGFNVLIVGEASISVEANEIDSADTEKGERIGVPIALIILLVLFGAVVAAVIPLLLALVSIVVALGATALVGQVFDLIFFVTVIISMIGLAVGIDYSLIILSRYREERRRGREKFDAIERAGATASRTVFFSGMMVVLALVGMFIIPMSVYQSMAAGAILVVIAAVMASLTLLPAVLALLGDKINAIRVPILGRRLERQASEQGGGFWPWITRMVMRRPVVFLVVAGGLMIGAASFVLDLNTGFNGADTFPDELQSKQAFLTLEQEFSFGVAAPTEIVIDGDVKSESVQAGIQRLMDLLTADADFSVEPTIRDNEAGDIALLIAYIQGEPSSDQAVDALARLREEHIPEAFERQGVQATVLVTGLTAFSSDFFDVASQYTPLVFAFVLGLSFMLLMVVFRSIVISEGHPHEPPLRGSGVRAHRPRLPEGCGS